VTAERRTRLRASGVKRAHKHIAVITRAIRQRNGVPFEVERKVCRDCRRILDEKPLKRAALS
jgi:hypothetical protein